jgi:hypothetical protein
MVAVAGVIGLVVQAALVAAHLVGLQQGLDLVHVQLGQLGQLRQRGLLAVAAAEAFPRDLDDLDLAAFPSGEEVHLAQLVEHGALHAHARVAHEGLLGLLGLAVAIPLEGDGGLRHGDQADLDQVGALHVGRQMAHQRLRLLAHPGLVLRDENRGHTIHGDHAPILGTEALPR